MKKKISLLVIITTLIGLVVVFDLLSYFDFNHLKTGITTFKVWYQEHSVLTIILFFFLYIFVTALSFPGAAILTISAGALFGLELGTIITSFASTIGATLAFLTSRYLFRNFIQNRFVNKLKVINQGIEKEGIFYLFALRLAPIFPFFLINLLMGLTSIKTWRFYWVSQIGMLAGTIIYVNAGTQLATLQSTNNILSLPVITAFILLGIFPLIAKKSLNWIQNKRHNYSHSGENISPDLSVNQMNLTDNLKPKKFDRNLIIIGAGAGGLVSAYIANAVQAKVTLIEAKHMGGDCLNFGCVPSKALINAGKVAKKIRQANQIGFDKIEPSFSFNKISEYIQASIKAIEPHDSVERYQAMGVDVLQGYAKLVDPYTVEITLNSGGTTRLTARNIILATGASPFIPSIEGLEQVNPVTSDTLWQYLTTISQLPQRILVIGGGVIGCELSQSFACLGAKVTLVEQSEQILPNEDVDIARLVQESLISDGVNVLTQHQVVRFYQQNGEKKAVLLSQQQQINVEFDLVLLATGRKARLTGYGLEKLGINTDHILETDAYLATTQYPHIFAVGDVVGSYQFTHFAAHQAWYAVVNSLFGDFKKFSVDYRLIPRVTFTSPEIAVIGLNECTAKRQNIEYEITIFHFNEFDKAIIEKETIGYIKVLTVPNRDKILGVTIVGNLAGTILQEFILAMKYNLGLNKVLATIHPYLTWSESNRYVAGIWKTKNTSKWILKLLKKYHSWRR